VPAAGFAFCSVSATGARGIVAGRAKAFFWEGFEHDLHVENSSNIVVDGHNFDRNPRYAVNGFLGAENNGILIRNSSEVGLTGHGVSGGLRRPAAVQVLECRRILINSNSILDGDRSGLLLPKVSDSILNGNMVSDDRAPDVRSPAVPISVAGGSGDRIGTNLIREK
jgi:hypothetical protein